MKKYRNIEGYTDPTAGKLLEAEILDEKRMNELIQILKYIIRLSGFELIGRIALRDKKSGRKYY